MLIAGHQLRSYYIAEDEFVRRDDLLRTLEVAPPVVDGKVRVIEIEGFDAQACGGTHGSTLYQPREGAPSDGHLQKRSLPSRSRLDIAVLCSIRYRPWTMRGRCTCPWVSGRSHLIVSTRFREPSISDSKSTEFTLDRQFVISG